MNARPKPVLLDVDPGIDDTLAILLALSSSELRLEAVTVVAGNVGVDQGVTNALRVLELAGRTDIPVARGAEAPLRGKLQTARHVHGRNGLGDIELPGPSNEPHPESAAQLIAAKAQACAGELSLIPVGPLTNIALALEAHPDLGKNIKEIVLMGGSFSGGNITPAAEFNIYNDPEAAEIVLGSGVPIVMVTLDVTRQTALEPEYLAGVERDTNPINRLVLDLSDFAIRTRRRKGILLHDPLAVGVAIDRSFVKTKLHYVKVETGDGQTRGATTTKPERSPNAEICTEVDAPRFVKFFVERVMGAPPPLGGGEKT